MCHCRKLAKSDKARAACILLLNRDLFVISSWRTCCLWNSTATQRLNKRQGERSEDAAANRSMVSDFGPLFARQISQVRADCVWRLVCGTAGTSTVAAAKYVYGWTGTVRQTSMPPRVCIRNIFERLRQDDAATRHTMPRRATPLLASLGYRWHCAINTHTHTLTQTRH